MGRPIVRAKNWEIELRVLDNLDEGRCRSRCGKPLPHPRPFDWRAGHTGKALASLEQQRHLKAGAQLGSQISRPSWKHGGQERMGVGGWSLILLLQTRVRTQPETKLGRD